MPSTPSSPIAASTASSAGRFPCTSEIRAMRRVSVSVAMQKVGYRLPVTALAAVVAAAVATLLIRPRSGLIEPAAGDLTAYFSAADIERAEDFRGPQRLLTWAGIALNGATLALLAIKLPRDRLR